MQPLNRSPQLCVEGERQRTDKSTHAAKMYCRGVSPLTAKQIPWIQKISADGECLHELVNRYGSPLHLHNVEPLSCNVDALQETARSRCLDFKVFFARKANKCLAYVDSARDGRFGIDTASLNEMTQSLQQGIPGEQIVYTAAIKEAAGFDLAIQSNVTIVIDNADELDALASRIRSQGFRKNVHWALRLRGFSFHDGPHRSRFGVPIHQASQLVDQFRDRHQDVANRILLKGLHFHLDSYDSQHRSEALQQTILLAETLRKNHDSLSFVDMGGGLPVCYLQHKHQWDAFWTYRDPQPECRGSHHGAVSLSGTRLDRMRAGNPAMRDDRAYPYWQPQSAPEWLAAVLDHCTDSKRSVAEQLVDAGIELRCEPGRALLDGCGVTVARVAFRKRDDVGDWIIGLMMNSTNCQTTAVDFCVDPIVVPAAKGARTAPGCGYFVGSRCMEEEYITARRMEFPCGIAVDDLVLFPNTAGYQMHLLESRAHQFDLPANLIFRDPGWTLDESI